MIIITKMKSKEEELLDIIYNNPKHWRFEELRSKAKIGKPQLARWLKIFEKEGIIKRIKEEKKMPYYTQDYDNPKFRNRKKIFALKKLIDTGFIDHLSNLNAKVVAIFGSFSRSDWYEDSDIDVFIYGSDADFDKGKFELKLNREIQVHKAKNTQELTKMKKLLPYVLSGEFIKGNIADMGIDIYFKTKNKRGNV